MSNNPIKRIGVRDARNHFADLLDQVRYQGEAVLIERAGKAVVAMIPAEQYEQFVAFQKQRTAHPPIPPGHSLRGAFPELAQWGEEEFDWAKEQWQNSLDRQLHRLDQGKVNAT